MRSLVVGTAGHIDHGKSALVKALTGTDPDRLKEERERGITIDLGFAHATIGDVAVAFVDVPGHERFIRNMLAGAGGIDGVLFVVAADESVMPQTREHFHICRLLGITRGVIALTKSDLVDRDVIELVSLEVRELMAHTPLAAAPIVPVSARTGAGLEALRAALVTLAEAGPAQRAHGLVRLPLDRAFVMKGFGTVVTGTLVSGTVREGDELTALPAGRTVRVRGVQVHGHAVAEATAPRRVALNLGAIESAVLARGVTLASEASLAVTRRIDARLQLIDGVRPLKHGARVRVHQGTNDAAGRVAIAATREADAGAWRPVMPGTSAAVPPGGEAYVRIRLEQPLAVTRDDRIVLRTYSPAATIGGALILDPEPPSAGLRRAGALNRFQQLDRDALEVWLDESGVQGLSAGDLIRRGGIDPAAVEDRTKSWFAAGRAVRANARIVATATARLVETRLLEQLARFHREHPLEPGIPRETLRELVTSGAPSDLFDLVLETMSARRLVKGTDRIALQTHTPTMPDDVARGRGRVEEVIRAAGLMPPDLAQIEAASGLRPQAVNDIVQMLLREHRLVRIDTLLFHADAVGELRRQVRDLKHTGPDAHVDVATFKARYGLSRKYAIPLLEWLDRERVTRRVGDRRVIL